MPVLNIYSLDDCILISIWNYPIISPGIWLWLDAHFPNFPQNRFSWTKRGSREEVQAAALKPETKKSQTSRMKGSFKSDWDQHAARLYTDGVGSGAVFDEHVSAAIWKHNKEPGQRTVSACCTCSLYKCVSVQFVQLVVYCASLWLGMYVCVCVPFIG